jgi:hypothetical protein
MYPFIRHFWLGPRAKCWDLHSLAVSPEYRNRGYGRTLVGWGLNVAMEEDISSSVLSAKGKEQFYRRCGYGEVVGWATDGEKNPLAGIVSSKILSIYMSALSVLEISYHGQSQRCSLRMRSYLYFKRSLYGFRMKDHELTFFLSNRAYCCRLLKPLHELDH